MEPESALCVFRKVCANMRKDKWKTIRDILIGNCKIVFPILVVLLGAVTVVVALNAKRAEAQATAEGQKETQEGGSVSASDFSGGSADGTRLPAEEVPMVASEDSAVYSLVATYYNAIGTGETETLRRICHGISENDLLYYGELSNYINCYSDIEIYSKQGPEDGTTIVYVYYKMEIVDHQACPGYETLYICTGEDGELYIKDASLFTEEETKYIKTTIEQVDVVEFNNRVMAEYNDLLENDPELFEYVVLVDAEVNTRVGEIIASQVQPEEGQEPVENQPGEEQGVNPPEQNPVESGPKYATASTTVNVRDSDSEQAEKLGRVTGGTRLEVQEVRVNGWTKIVYNGQDGYIKSEFLQFEENLENLAVIGTVTAATNVNVRVAGDESAARLGMLSAGATLDLLANENGWCKVNYNGQVGYIKAEFVTQQ